MTLRHVLGRSDAKRRNFLFGEVVSDRQRLEGSERTDDAMDVVFLDQLLRLGPCGRRNTGRVGDDQIDLAARQRIFPFLQKHRQRQIHVDAARGEGACLCGQQPDPNRVVALRGEGKAGRRDFGDPRAGDAADKLSSRYLHWILPRTPQTSIDRSSFR